MKNKKTLDIYEYTLQTIKKFVKNNKTGPTVTELSYELDLSYNGTRDRVSELLKSKKIVKDKKLGYLTLKK